MTPMLPLLPVLVECEMVTRNYVAQETQINPSASMGVIGTRNDLLNRLPHSVLFKRKLFN